MQRVEFHPAGVPDAVRAAFADFASAFAQVRGVEVDRNRLRHVERVEIGGCTCYLKRFHGVQWKNLFWLRTTAPRAWSQAEREFRVARALEEAGLCPGRPLLFGDRTAGPLHTEQQSLFLSQALPGESFRERLLRGTSRAEREVMRRAAVRALGAAFARGIRLPDMSLDHLFWLGDAGANGPRVGLIDFHNGSLGQGPGRKATRRALRHLARSLGAIDPEARLVRTGERLRFLAGLLRQLPALGPARAWAARLPALPDLDYDAQGRAARYRSRSPDRDRREQRLLREVLGEALAGRSVLDLPAGSGRLLPLLRDAGASAVLQADRAVAMLRAAGAGEAAAWRCVADARRLPVRTAAIDVVLCFRFLHHLPPDQARQVLSELCRVARERVVFSFFHPASLHHLRRRSLAWLRGRPGSRHALAPGDLRRWLRDAGFELEAVRGELPLLRELWVARARRVAPPQGRG